MACDGNKPHKGLVRPDPTRRQLTEAGGIAGLLTVLGLGPAIGQQASGMLGPPGMKPADPAARAFFTDDEAAFIRAATARLIPSDGDGPGAIETDVPNFIDKQLGGPFGSGQRLFMPGPHDPRAAPELGYQLPYTPAEMFRRALGAIKARTGQAPFTAMAEADQDTFLSEQLEKGGLGDLDGVPAKVFFEQLHLLTIQGYFADPVYGGNKDMVAWKAIGFPGAYAAFRDTIGLYNQPFRIGPVSLADHDALPEHDMKAMEAQQ